MRAASRAEWPMVVALLFLALIPIAAGFVRLSSLAAGGPADAGSVRFFANPAPVIMHIVGSMLFSVGGAFQFLESLRRRFPVWHRLAGRVIWFAGLAVALSGLWMAITYAIVPADTWLLHLFRLAAGTAMLATLILGFAAIRRRDVPAHRAWMLRAYAIGMGAGTQALVILPVALLAGPPNAWTYSMLMGLGWVINSAVAEWRIRAHRAPARRSVTDARAKALGSV